MKNEQTVEEDPKRKYRFGTFNSKTVCVCGGGGGGGGGRGMGGDGGMGGGGRGAWEFIWF